MGGRAEGGKALGFSIRLQTMDLSFAMALAGQGSFRNWGGFAGCQWVSCSGTVGITEV